MKLFICMVCVLFMMGCVTVSRAQWCDDNNVTGEYRKAIVNTIIKLGMTKEMVCISWYEPTYINTYNAGYTEQWVYEIGYSSTYFYFEDGILVDWQKFN